MARPGLLATHVALGASARAAVHILQLIGPLPASFAASPSRCAPDRAFAMATNPRERAEDDRSARSHAASEWKRFLEEGRNWRAISQFWAGSLVKNSALLPIRGAGSDVSHWVAPQSVHSSATEWYAAPGFSNSHWRKERTTFLAEIAYVGEHFSGLQRHPGQRTIIGCLEQTLSPLLASPSQKAERIPGLAVSGRTDASVSAYGQVLSLHTWRDVGAGEIADAINGAAPAEINALRVLPVPRAFHANFAATWRRYLYLFPLRQMLGQADSLHMDSTAGDSDCAVECSRSPGTTVNAGSEGVSLLEVDVERVNEQLKHIRNRPLHYNALAYKDIKKLHLNDDADVCTLHEARAFLLNLPSPAGDEDETAPERGSVSPGVTVLAFELKADRFLRRMVRILVSTAVREAKLSSPPDSLLRIVLSGERSLAAVAAPGLGLCFVGAGYEQYDQSIGGAAIRHRGARGDDVHQSGTALTSTA
jgi:tRNA U38,U39,U40 pseudouridine synthase TruA